MREGLAAADEKVGGVVLRATARGNGDPARIKQALREEVGGNSCLKYKIVETMDRYADPKAVEALAKRLQPHILPGLPGGSKLN